MIQSAGTGAVRELSVLKHIVASHASVPDLFSASKSSAISLGFRGSSYLSSTGKKQNSQSQACTGVSPPCLSPRGSVIFPDVYFTWNSLLPPLCVFIPFPSFKAPAIAAHRICCALWILCTFYQCHEVSLFYLSHFISCVSFFEGRNRIFSLDSSQPPRLDNDFFLMSS